MSERLSVSEFARRDGCSEKLVRRALERGKLERDRDGKLDAAQVGTPWRRSAMDGRKPRRPGEAPAAPVPAEAAPAKARRARAARRKPVRPEVRAGNEEGADAAAPQLPVPAPAAPGESEQQRIARLASPGLPSYAASAQREKAAMAQMRELELAQRQGRLVDVEAARTLFFNAFRAIRDHWLALPSGQSALIAAKLDCDPDLVSEVLIEHVRKHAAKLTEPAFDLRRGA